MPELPVPLSAVGLRLAGQVGQTTLNRLKDDGAARIAEFDQHVATVRAELTGCASVADAQRAGLTAGRKAPASGVPPIRTDATCPDVPFTGSALRPESVLSLRLLLHYTCGFVEAVVSADWWPAEHQQDSDWESMRLAAVCHLISTAEAAAELPPDLRATA